MRGVVNPEREPAADNTESGSVVSRSWCLNFKRRERKAIKLDAFECLLGTFASWYRSTVWDRALDASGEGSRDSIVLAEPFEHTFNIGGKISGGSEAIFGIFFAAFLRLISPPSEIFGEWTRISSGDH